MIQKPPEPPVSPTDPPRTFDGPPPPREGDVYVGSGLFWKVHRVVIADDPVGFYLVHLCHGESVNRMHDTMVLGPREFAALVRDRDLRPHLHAA